MVGCGGGEDSVVVVTGTVLLMIHFSPPSCFMCCTVCGVSVIVCETIGCGCDCVVTCCCGVVCCTLEKLILLI